MTLTSRIPRAILVAFLPLLIVVLPLPGAAASDAAYEYEEKDEEAEQRVFVKKLRGDNKKVDMAIQNTKTLIGRSKGRGYLPELYLRLAELYVEKSRIVYFIRKHQVSDSLETLKQIESKNLKLQAIEVYQRILDTFPGFEAEDKIHFFMAHEYRELGQIEDMAKEYRKIISRYKKSRYVPESYLLLGDYFSNEGDLATAISHYKKVLNYPQSPAAIIAQYKLAWCHINQKDFKKAIKLFEACVKSDTKEDVDIDTYRRVDIRLEALIDMAYSYPECYKKAPPDKAISYFRTHAWSRPVYTAVLEKLAYRYYIKKKWRHAATIYRQLSELQHDAAKLLEYARNTFECVQELGDFQDAHKDMAHITKALKKQKYSIHIPEEEKKKTLTDYELYARNIVTVLHDRARTDKSLKSFKRAADAYDLYLGFFEDSPVRDDMEANYAEALFASSQYLEAGKWYEKIAERKTELAMQTEPSLYSTVISYYSAIKQKDKLNYYELAYARDGLRTAGGLYAKYYPTSARVPDVAFNVAWIAYDEGKYDQCIAEFTQFLKQYPSGKSAKAAAHLVLDAYQFKEDYTGLAQFGKGILQEGRIRDSKFLADVSQLVKASESKIVSSLTVSAVTDWEKGRTELMETADKNQDSGLGEQALMALLVSGKEKKDISALHAAGSKLIQRYPNTENAEKTLNVMIETFSKASQFRLLADYLEEFARRYPKNKLTRDFYAEAGRIRQALGLFEQSNRNYRQYLSGTTSKRSLKEEVVFSMADNAERAGSDAEAIDVLKRYRTSLSKAGRITADARIADLYLRKGSYKQAVPFRREAYKAYSPSMGKKNAAMKDAVAGMVFNSVDRPFQRYMGTKLSKRIDNKIVQDKTQLLQKLEKGYVEVIQYASPRWALKACYRSYEINREFAHFLRNAPLPELTRQQKKEYLKIVDKNVRAYTDKADEYLKACVAQARKWETCDPELAAYFLDSTRSGGSGGIPDFSSSSTASARIASGFMQDETLKQAHEKLFKSPEDPQAMVALAQAYIRAGDYLHAGLVARKAVTSMPSGQKKLKSAAYNLLGVCYLYDHKDSMAKDALKKAVEVYPDLVDARINLAGLYRHYGHLEKADELYRMPSGKGTVRSTEHVIHPRAWELYDDSVALAKK